MNWLQFIIVGFVATAALSVILAAATGLRLTRLNLPFLVGSLLCANRMKAFLFGLPIHFVIGWIFTFFYLLAFIGLGVFSLGMGILLGFLHGAFVLTVGFIALPAFHPRMTNEDFGPQAARLIEPPGFLGLYYGYWTPVFVLVSHIAFGALIGYFIHNTL